MRRETYKNLRYSEKVRESQCFIEADGLQKKIRKFNAGKSSGSIDAEMKMREIECFWKEGWEYNHTHHIYLEPKVTRPQFYLPYAQEETHQQLGRYYQLLQMYLTRLKIDNEDQTNFKIQQRDLPLHKEGAREGKSEMEMEIEDMMQFDEAVDQGGIANLAFDHLARVFGDTCQEMLANFSRSIEISQNDMMEGCLDEQQFAPLHLLSQACRLSREQEGSVERQHTEWFMRLVMEVVHEANSSKQYSAVLSTQPEMGELSAILHPLCWGLYSTFSKEILTKEAKRTRGRRYADEQDEPLTLSAAALKQKMAGRTLLAIKDEFKLEEQSHSRVAFINLDGFESEFTLQFMRNFADNVMYVSFPKFQQGSQNSNYSNRFHKKIMYNFTRSELDILGCFDDENMDAINLTIEREDLMNNPEKYHETIDQLYQSAQSNTKPEDFNRNLYVFPIGLGTLNAELDISVADKNIEGYQSHFIRFILRDHIYSALRAFKPKLVFFSYSGKVQIENEHFLEMLQEVVKICPKVALFPNFTSVFTRSGQSSTHSVGRGIISRDEQSDLQNKVERYYGGQAYNPWQVALMDKLSVFLKVTAGYYTLQRPFEEEDFAAKFNNTRVFRYIIFLYHALKNQYEHCKRRVEPATLETARASLQANIKEHSKEITRCIPQFHSRLFQFITELLRNNLEENEYSLAAEQIRDKFPPTFEEDEPYLRQWAELQRGEELMLASAKYHEISQLQVRQKASRDEYLSVKDERMSNLDCLYRISFYYKEDSNQIVKLYKDVVLLWKEQQPLGRNYFHVVLSNLFTPGEQEIQHYIAKPKINTKKMQRCQIIPITFHSRQGLIPRQNIFKVWTEWNYAETAHQVLLYWPSEFDFISYYLSKLLQRKYEPVLIRRLFAARKTNESLGKHDSAFYEVNIGENVDVAPRWGCSSFNVEDQLYILGGSYDAEHSYLNLQNDVTTIDLTDNNPENFTPAKLRNINKELYANEAFWGKLRQGRQVNSFVRPRQEFQFYDQDELIIEEGVEQGQRDNDIRRIYMIGGYGEEFKTPYSLYVNYFYQITVERASRRLLSIKKRVVPERVIPINVRAMIKNRGVYQKANILYLSQMVEQQQKCKEGMTNNRHYFHHQVVYAIKNGQLHYKIKNLFATELYQHSKRDFHNFARRMGEVRNAEEPETVLIRKVEGNKHQVLVEISDIYYIYSLNLQLKGEEVDEIPLMNESIISLDTKKLAIFALISHSRHTNSRSILATESVRIPSQAIIAKEKHYALVLKEVMRFQGNLNLHTLIICNANEIVLLHGIAFEKCRNRQFMIKMKSKSEIKREELNMVSVSPQQFSAITTFFSKKNNVITSINFLQIAGENHYFAVHGLMLDINRFSEGWKPCNQANRICFMHGGALLQRVRMEMRIDSFADINSVILMLYAASGKIYHVKLCQIFNCQNQLVQAEQVTDRSILERFRCMQCLAKIVKNEELYDDFEYFQ